jgi:hypothetical protein
MEIVQTADNLCDFVISGKGILALVRVRKSRRLHSPVAQIEEDFSGAIADARRIPCGGPVSRELWLYSRFGILRFFRILDDGIVELDRRGAPLTECGTNPMMPVPGDTELPTAGPPAAGVGEGRRSQRGLI